MFTFRDWANVIIVVVNLLVAGEQLHFYFISGKRCLKGNWVFGPYAGAMLVVTVLVGLTFRNMRNSLSPIEIMREEEQHEESNQQLPVQPLWQGQSMMETMLNGMKEVCKNMNRMIKEFIKPEENDMSLPTIRLYQVGDHVLEWNNRRLITSISVWIILCNTVCNFASRPVLIYEEEDLFGLFIRTLRFAVQVLLGYTTVMGLPAELGRDYEQLAGAECITSLFEVGGVFEGQRRKFAAKVYHNRSQLRNIKLIDASYLDPADLSQSSERGPALVYLGPIDSEAIPADVVRQRTLSASKIAGTKIRRAGVDLDPVPTASVLKANTIFGNERTLIA